jgi:hypothetical protein
MAAKPDEIDKFDEPPEFMRKLIGGATLDHSTWA